MVEMLPVTCGFEHFFGLFAVAWAWALAYGMVFFFCLYMFGVVIVLANVLIAIVTDSYGVIKNERAGES